MRIVSVIFCLLFAVSVFAALPEYNSSRKWIVEHTPKENIPKAPWIFVGDDITTTNTYIFHYKDSDSLRDIIDKTDLKKTRVFVIVLRSEHPTEPVFFNFVEVSDKPKFQIMADDIIWLGSGDIN